MEIKVNSYWVWKTVGPQLNPHGHLNRYIVGIDIEHDTYYYHTVVDRKLRLYGSMITSASISALTTFGHLTVAYRWDTLLPKMTFR